MKLKSLFLLFLSSSVLADPFNSAFVIEVRRPNGVFTCTGIAVSSKYILTAGHCLSGRIKEVRVFNQNHYDPNSRFLKIKNFKIHPDYHPEQSLSRSDLARIELKKHLPRNIQVFPLAVVINKNHTFYRIGFGMRNGENLRTVLKTSFLKLNLDDESLVLKDEFSVSGDSGGPILIEDQGYLYLAAIHSTLSFGPEGRFSLNPLLAHKTNWIFDY